MWDFADFAVSPVTRIAKEKTRPSYDAFIKRIVVIVLLFVTLNHARTALLQELVRTRTTIINDLIIRVTLILLHNVISSRCTMVTDHDTPATTHDCNYCIIAVLRFLKRGFSFRKF